MKLKASIGMANVGEYGVIFRYYNDDGQVANPVQMVIPCDDYDHAARVANVYNRESSLDS